MDDPGKLLRLFREINLLASSKRGYTVNELAERLGISYRTVYRDLKIFEATGFELIQQRNKRYRLAKAEEISENLNFSKEEADVLHQSLLTLGDSPIKGYLIDKIQALSESAVKVNLFKKAAISSHIKQVADAIRLKKQVILCDYQSARSQRISDRFVEPFAFSDNGASVQCFEISSKTNKFFKLERIGHVKMMERFWQYEFLHEKQEEDIFNMSIKEPIDVHIRMGLLAYNLLKEEYPSSVPYIREVNQTTYELKTKVAGFKAIGRFALGLMDDIEIVAPDDFKVYLRDIIESNHLFSVSDSIK